MNYSRLFRSDRAMVYYRHTEYTGVNDKIRLGDKIIGM